MTLTSLVLWALCGLAVATAAAAVLTRNVSYSALALGAFFASVAGLFAYHGFSFLALAEMFLYVGGVLVLVLFALMLVHRSGPGEPVLTSRHDPLAAVACAGLAAFIVVSLRPLVGVGTRAGDKSVTALGDALLGPLLPHFEVAGLLLLAALVAVVVVSRGGAE